MALIIMAAVCGNVLVIVSAVRFERLRIIANSFLVSLAVADLLVAVLVMPFNALQQVAGRWPFGPVVCLVLVTVIVVVVVVAVSLLFGPVVCDVFNANDVLFSTASLLHLCCVRYYYNYNHTVTTTTTTSGSPVLRPLLLQLQPYDYYDYYYY